MSILCILLDIKSDKQLDLNSDHYLPIATVNIEHSKIPGMPGNTQF
jgi:hypothetical protein